MCGLCGLLGGGAQWTDGAALRLGADAPTRRRERLERAARLNRVLAHYALQASDWQGSAYLLSTRTGRTEVVEDLGQLWHAAERLLGRPLDPLDPALLRRLEAGA